MSNLETVREAESSVVGAVMLDPSSLDLVSDLLAPDDFTDAQAGLIFGRCLAMKAAGVGIDLISVTESLQSAGELSKAGGPAKVSDLAGRAMTATNIEHWSKIVRSYSLRRKAVATAQKIIQEAQEGPEDVEAWLGTASAKFVALGASGSSRDAIPVRDLASQGVDDIRRIVSGQVSPGIKTGINGLNKALLGGFRAGELIILAGRPGAGKSALALQMALHMSLNDYRVAYFSLEMSKEQLVRRALCQGAGVSMSSIKPQGLTDADLVKLEESGGGLASRRLLIDDTPHLSAAKLSARCRRLARKEDLDVVIVDYLQLMSGERKKGDNREREVAEMSRAAKVLSREMKIPVVMLSQLNRSSESRAEGRVQLSDLRESGAIEQDADVVLAVYRPAMISPDKFEEKFAVLEILKQRQGPSNLQIELEFVRRETRFTEWMGRKGGRKDG